MRIANVNEAMYGKEPSAKDSLSTLLDYYSKAHTKEEKKTWFLEWYNTQHQQRWLRYRRCLIRCSCRQELLLESMFEESRRTTFVASRRIPGPAGG